MKQLMRKNESGKHGQAIEGNRLRICRVCAANPGSVVRCVGKLDSIVESQRIWNFADLRNTPTVDCRLHAPYETMRERLRLQKLNKAFGMSANQNR
jgi:hypothetical protein